MLLSVGGACVLQATMPPTSLKNVNSLDTMQPPVTRLSKKVQALKETDGNWKKQTRIWTEAWNQGIRAFYKIFVT